MWVTIVTGAGASKEIGLPTGDELKVCVRRLLHLEWEFGGRFVGDASARQLADNITANRCFGLSQEKYSEAAHFIRQRVEGAFSIDDFLNIHRQKTDAQAVGKVAIAQSILFFENGSHMQIEGFRDSEVMKILSSNWLSQMWSIICKSLGGVDLSRFKNGNFPLKIITFNYDRTVELFTYHMAMQTLSLSAKAAADFLSGIEIIHVYGMIGTTSFVDQRLGGNPNFGDKGFLTGIVSVAKRTAIENTCNGIATYNEGIEQGRLTRIREVMAGSSQIYLCGMGYHRQNMEALLPNRFTKGANVYGTGVGLSEQKIRDVVRGFNGRPGISPLPEIHQSWTASDMLRAVGHNIDEYLHARLTS